MINVPEDTKDAFGDNAMKRSLKKRQENALKSTTAQWGLASDNRGNCVGVQNAVLNQ